jgi:uracil-DNA glycosylase
MAKAAFECTKGPHDAKIVLVGESWGEKEKLLETAFVGAAGHELNKLLEEAGIDRKSCLFTNTFNLKPFNNDILQLCTNKKEAGKEYPLPMLATGKYIDAKYFPELERLHDELTAHPRNLVIALGNTAAWAVLGARSISKIRGSTATATQAGQGLKVLPTYHPAAVLRNWSLRVIVIADLMKAKREAEFPEIRRPKRRILINPTLEQIESWLAAAPIPLASVDIETKARQITMISIARSRDDAIVIPFFDENFVNYWSNPLDEISAWKIVRRVMTDRAIPKLWQNGLYDIQYLWKMGIPIYNCHDDTMLLSHALYPEMQKGLGFLGSVYTDESSWKLMRHRPGAEVVKKDE